MELRDVINPRWLDAEHLNNNYISASPFPHVVMEDFINETLLEKVADEFPDLAKAKDEVHKFDNPREIKLASKGMQALTPSAAYLTSYLQSDLFLKWLNTLTGIKEPLISDPYLAGGGYHEIKRNGLLKVHADFNKHHLLDLDRRLNLLLYLNKDWDDEWDGTLQLFDSSMSVPIQKIYPRFNTAVIFTTTSFTYHGHPDPLKCPSNRSRRSLAYYYFSTGRPNNEVSSDNHSTLFKEREGETFKTRRIGVKDVIREITPPILIRVVRRIL
ncbi:2OG-Fe(II) oxygenase [Acidihalobacter aeolianus]|uniref:2OG-Fe(II) oxygenase n=1 Tax=Acidihalobacter aeolianus TaxID=2792603 RepID=UPI0009F5EEEA|nr:2OG-Fe(II) oxygenase [Acidihalobacter aeolianus]